MYRGQTGISHWWNITHDRECTGDRQEYHTDGTLHMKRNVKLTKQLKGERWISTLVITHRQTDRQTPQIVDSRAALFAAKKDKLFDTQHFVGSIWWLSSFWLGLDSSRFLSCIRTTRWENYFILLAPTGAQCVTMFVHPSVRLSRTKC